MLMALAAQGLFASITFSPVNLFNPNSLKSHAKALRILYSSVFSAGGGSDEIALLDSLVRFDSWIDLNLSVILGSTFLNILLIST